MAPPTPDESLTAPLPTAPFREVRSRVAPPTPAGRPDGARRTVTNGSAAAGVHTVRANGAPVRVRSPQSPAPDALPHAVHARPPAPPLPTAQRRTTTDGGPAQPDADCRTTALEKLVRTAAPGAGMPTEDRRTVVAGAVALLCLVAALLEATADLLPDEPLFWVLTPLRLVVVIGLAAVAVIGVRPAQLRSPLDVPVALLLLTTAAATVLAGQPWSPWRGVLTAVGVFYLAVGVRRALPDSFPAVSMLALVAVAVAGTTAARQFANGTDTGFCRGSFDGSADFCGGDELIRATGTFSNPNLLAAFLVLLLPLAAAGAMALADRTARLVGTAAVVVGYAAVLFTASRGGILAALAGVAAFVVLRRPTRRRLLVAGGISVLGVVAMAVASGGRFGVRSDVWSAAVSLLLDEPLGVGPGRAGALIDTIVPGDEAFTHAHNLWLNWAVEAGVPGLLAVLALTALTALVVLRAAARGSDLAVAAGAGLAGFAVMSLADHPANAVRISIALWAVLGLVAAESLSARFLTLPLRSRPVTGARRRRVQSEGSRSVGVPVGARSRSGSR